MKVNSIVLSSNKSKVERYLSEGFLYKMERTTAFGRLVCVTADHNVHIILVHFLEYILFVKTR